jgi:hypothetical protein
MIYWRNNRTPTKELVIHLFHKYTAEDKEELNLLRKKIFRYLKEHGIEAVANIELTKGNYDEPNGRVHFHVLTDNDRSEKELRKLFNEACSRQGLVGDNDYRIDYKELWNGHEYYKYFTKWGEKYRNEVILFQNGLRVQKFYEIGKWFNKSKTEIRKEVLAERRAWCQTQEEAKIEQESFDDYVFGIGVEEGAGVSMTAYHDNDDIYFPDIDAPTDYSNEYELSEECFCDTPWNAQTESEIDTPDEIDDTADIEGTDEVRTQDWFNHYLYCNRSEYRSQARRTVDWRYEWRRYFIQVLLSYNDRKVKPV